MISRNRFEGDLPQLTYCAQSDWRLPVFHGLEFLTSGTSDVILSAPSSLESLKPLFGRLFDLVPVRFSTSDFSPSKRQSETLEGDVADLKMTVFANISTHSAIISWLFALIHFLWIQNISYALNFRILQTLDLSYAWNFRTAADRCGFLWLALNF